METELLPGKNLYFFIPLLIDSSSFFKECPGGSKEQYHCGGIFDRYHPEGTTITEMLGYNTTQKTTDSEPQVPTGQNTAVSSTTLIVAGNIDKHIQEGWIQMTISQSYQCS